MYCDLHHADGTVVPADHRLALGNKANQLWHTDSSFKRDRFGAFAEDPEVITGARR
jgi:hypothetical protein